MMTVILYDRDRATYERVEHVIQINSNYTRVRGKPAIAYDLLLENGHSKLFKKCRYDLERVQLEVV